MKKIYAFIAAAIVAGSASAQTVNFTRNNEVIEKGSTFEFTEVEIQDWSDMGLGYIFEFNPDLYITTSADVNVDVVANCTTGQIIGMCCGGECEKGQTVTKENIKLVAGSDLKVRFDYGNTVMDLSGIPSFVSTDLTVYKAGTKTALTSITVVFKYGENGVAAVITNDKSFSFANGAINYTVEGNANAALYNAEGKCVLNTEVNGQGSISTTGIPAGIYIYRLGNKTGKIFIR